MEIRWFMNNIIIGYNALSFDGCMKQRLELWHQRWLHETEVAIVISSLL